jgi:hypothetical protein
VLSFLLSANRAHPSRGIDIDIDIDIGIGIGIGIGIDIVAFIPVIGHGIRPELGLAPDNTPGTAMRSAKLNDKECQQGRIN